MADEGELRGRRLYDALIALKPAALAETDWASKAGVNRGFFTNLKTSEISPRTDTLDKLLRHVGRSRADLDLAAAGRAPPPHPDLPITRSADAGEVVEIVAVDLSYAMGEGRTLDDYLEEEPFHFDLAFIRSISRSPPHRLRLARGIGDSMLPTLQSYDRVMVDTTQNRLQLDDRVYAISREGAGSIKRLRRATGKRILVKSDNPHVDDYEVDEAELIIHGRVIWFARDL